MNEYIARLIRTGMPRKVAVYMCLKYRRKPDTLSEYVKAVEEECYEQVGILPT